MLSGLHRGTTGHTAPDMSTVKRRPNKGKNVRSLAASLHSVFVDRSSHISFLSFHVMVLSDDVNFVVGT